MGLLYKCMVENWIWELKIFEIIVIEQGLNDFDKIDGMYGWKAVNHMWKLCSLTQLTPRGVVNTRLHGIYAN